MTILEFVDRYNRCETEQLKDRFLKEKLEVKSYLPILTKDTLATKLVDSSTYEYENYLAEDETLKRRKTGRIRLNSVAQYILFCRIVIENYTNLKVETDGFFEEYDVLKQSGLLNKLMFPTEKAPAILPIDDIEELRSIIKMKQDDILTNEVEPGNYISNQIERITTITGVTVKPILEKISDELENIDDKKIEKLIKVVERGLKRVK
jgi:hypothetical protein